MHWVNKDILFILRESFNLRQHLTAFLKYLIRVIGGADLTDASGPDMAASPAAASTEA